MMAGLDGPIYVERVGLFNNQQRFRAKKAITKALQLQVENKGFSFVEVLAECPTHLKMTPLEAEQWVEEEMVPIYPLGVKKDLEPEPWFDLGPPTFDPDALLSVIGSSDETVPRFADGFPDHLDLHDVSLKFAGAGGDGAQTIAKLTCTAAINEGFDGTYIPSYGPESRGGTSYADVHVARDEVLSPSAPSPHVLVAFNAPSLEKFGPTVAKGGLIVYDETVIADPPDLDPSIRCLGVPFTQLAMDLGEAMVKNVVALGAFQAATQLLPAESFRTAMDQALHGDVDLLRTNEDAFARGQQAAQDLLAAATP